MKKLHYFLVLAFIPLLTMCYGPYGPMMGGGDRSGNYGCVFGYGYGGMFMWIIFLILVGLLIYFIVRNLKTKGSTMPGESPVDILKRRYAKGEITKEEYEKIKKDIE
ncbi:MAG: SHOCT domain-containing protein [Smithella sp.]